MGKLEFGNPDHIYQRQTFEKEQWEKDNLRKFRVTRTRTMTTTERVELSAVDEVEAKEIAEDDCLNWEEVDSDCDGVFIEDVEEILDPTNVTVTAEMQLTFTK